jgi:aspartyl/asparaginyl-tRNA synthetase
MINYGIIDQANDYYSQRGYVRIETPWTVTKEVSNITKPFGAREFQLVHDNDKVLVASGEQGFLYLYLKDFLPKGTFQTTTPCFRFENFDTLHTKYFVKTELIKTDSTTQDDLTQVIDDALQFFGRYFPKNHLCIKQIDLPSGIRQFDINYLDVELGSYGIRECDFLKWVYGTGIAEPRMSQTMKKYGISYKRD